jgi:hypothetical protein
MPAIPSSSPVRNIPDPGFRPAIPERILARVRRAFRLKSETPVISVVTEQMLTRAPHIDTVTVTLKYPGKEQSQERLDMRA